MSVTSVLASLCTESQAGIVSYQVSTDAAGQFGLTNFSKTLAVPAFDSKLGTLTSVSFSFTTVEAKIGGTLKNKSAGSVPAFTISDTVTFAASFASDSSTGTLNAFSTYNNVAKGDTVTYGGFDLKGSTTATTITDVNRLANYEGTSPLLFTYAANALVSIGGTGGNAFVDIKTQSTAVLTINYNFTPGGVPEPASLAMTVLGGLLVVGWVRKRRRAGSSL